MSGRFLLAVALLVLTPWSAFAQRDVRLEFEGRYWFPKLKGNVKVTENDMGTDIDLKRDLGIKNEYFPEARLTWYTGPKSKIRLAYTQVGFESSENINRTIEFSGQAYSVGTRVATNLDVKYLRLAWVWQFINFGQGTAKLGTLLEGKGFWGKASLEAPDLRSPVKETERFLFGLPTIGVALDMNPHKMLNFFAEGSGLYAGSYGYVYDAEAGIKLIPARILSILGGYRVCEMKAKDDFDFAKLRLYGPFVGVTVRF